MREGKNQVGGEEPSERGRTKWEGKNQVGGEDYSRWPESKM